MRSLPAFGLLGFHRLAEAITFAVHLEDVTAMRQAIQQSRRHPLALKNLPPVAKGQVAGEQQAAALVAIGEHLEEQLGSSPAEGQIAQLIADQELGLVELTEEAVELILFLRFFEALHQD